MINTNVWRSGPDYDANVTAGLFELNNKKNNWNLGGKLAMSNRFGYLPGDNTQTGFSHELHIAKTSGRFNFNLSQERTDTKYNSDDMGYFTNNNFLNHYLYMGYKWTEPKSWYNRIFLNFNSHFSVLSKKIAPIDKTYQSARINFNSNVQSKKLWWIGSHVGYSFEQQDFYEPRAEGWHFKRGASISLGSWFESNTSKKYSWSAEAFTRSYINFYNSFAADIFIRQNMRFNNKFSLTQRISFEPRFNNMGYTYVSGSSDINFAKRKVNTIEHILSAKYSFSNKMGITFRARHYLSTVDNKEFYILQRDGNLLLNQGFQPDANQNVNFFNIDMVYTLQFAPGSFLNIVWKNATQQFSNDVESGYFKNFHNTIREDNNNNLSLKVIYFFDYLSLKSRSRKAGKKL
jgi:archaellin